MRKNIFHLTLKSPGIGEVITIFWTINDPPGLQGLKIQTDYESGNGSEISLTLSTSLDSTIL